MKNRSDDKAGTPPNQKNENVPDPLADSGDGSARPDYVAMFKHFAEMPTLMRVVSEITGLRLVVVAHVADDSWTAVSVHDTMDFGLEPGGTLDVRNMLCDEVRERREPLVIEHAAEDVIYRGYPLEKIYGIESYIAVPIILKGGEFFGTLCAFDSRPTDLTGRHILPTFELFAGLIAADLDRQQTLRALTANEERYRAFIANSSEGIWRFEVDEPIPVDLPADEQVRLAFERGYLAECNDAMARQYGHTSAKDLAGARLTDLMMADDPKNIALLRAFVESGYKLVDAESHEHDIHGNDRYFLNSFTGLVENGRMVGAWGSQRDITESRKTSLSTARLAAIVKSSDDAIISKDLDGVITSWNRAAEQMFGYTAEEAIGRSIDILVPPRLAAEENEIIGRIRKAEGVDHLETVRTRKDGVELDVSLTVSPMLDDAGRTIGASTIARDITERRRSEELINQNQLMLTLAMQSSRMGAWERDIQADMIWWSEELEEIFGLAPGEFSGTDEHYRKLVYDVDRERTAAEVARAVAEHRPYVMEFRFYHADGSVRWMEGRGQAVYSQAGDPVRLYGVGIDITERRAADERRIFLASLDRAVQQVIEPHEVMSITARMLGEHLGVNRCAYAEVDDDEDTFHITGDHTSGTFSIVGDFKMSDFGDEILRLMRANEPFVADDVERDERAKAGLEGYRRTDVRALICVPLHKHNKFVAVIAVHQNTPRHWTADEIELVRTVVGRCWESLERTRAARAVRESDERFRLALSSGAVTVYQQDTDLRYTWVYPSEPYSRDLIGKTDIDLSPDAHGKLLTSLKRKVIETGEPTRAETAATVLDKTHWYDLLVEPRRNARGEIIGVGGAALEITERKRAEAERAESEERFQQAANAAPVLLWIADTTRGCYWFNKPWLDFTGRTLDEEYGFGWTSGVHPDDLQPSTAVYNEAFDARRGFSVEYRLRRHDGEYRWLLDNGVPRVDSDGEFRGFIGSCIDITERKEAESAMQRYQLLSEHARDVIWLLRPDGTIVEVNRAATELYGYEHDELAGKNVRDLRHKSTHGTLQADLKRAASGSVHFETIHVKKDGTAFPVEVTAAGAEIGGERFLMSIIRDTTERKRAETVLRESEERFVKAFNASPLVVTITSLRTGKLTEVNQTFCDITGYAREEAVGRSTDELGLWDKNVDRSEELDALRNFGSIRNKEYVFRLRDGSEIVGLLSAEMIEIGGEPCALTVIQDVTERKRSEETLRRSERRLQEMADAMPQVVWVADADGNVTYYNHRVQEFFGFEQDAQGHWNWRPGVHPDDAKATGEAWAAATRGGTYYSIEHRLTMLDGSYRWHLSRAIPIKDSSGRTRQWYGTATDIHDIRQAQEALVAAERHAAEEYQGLLARIIPLAETLGRARDLVTVYRKVGDFIRSSMPCSAFFVSFFDPRTQMRTAAYVWSDEGEVDISDLPPMALSSDGGPNSQAVYQKRSVIVNDYMEMMRSRPHIVLQENGVEPHSAVAVPLLIMDRVIGTFEVQAYDDNAFAAEHVIALEMAASLAAVAIENVRLIEIEAEARAEAESANQAKDEFLSVLSHELRTPLNAMLGWVRMLRSDVLDKESAAKALEVIERNTRLQGSLIEDLLDVSRIISGKMRIETEVTDLVNVISTVSETVGPLALAKNIRYEFNNGGDNIILEADPVRIQQVVSNLVQNAIKFTPAGGSITVEARREGGSAFVTVTDTGVGIEPAFLPHIFDRFRQADASTKRNYAGLGLGLTIARTIVALHGGEIDVHSDGANQGCRFTVRLPLAADFYAPPSGENAVLATGGSALAGLRILLVDDDVDSLTPVKMFLESESATAATAGSAADALEKLSSGDFDVLISDIGMPRTDGLELIRAVRESENGGRPIVAIAVTAYASDEDRERALDAGFQSHMSKPVNFDDLLSILISLR